MDLPQVFVYLNVEVNMKFIFFNAGERQLIFSTLYVDLIFQWEDSCEVRLLS